MADMYSTDEALELLKKRSISSEQTTEEWMVWLMKLGRAIEEEVGHAAHEIAWEHDPSPER